jgi:DNA-binding LytR/AlgR family response regulator
VYAVGDKLDMNKEFKIAVCDDDVCFTELIRGKVLNIMQKNNYACKITELYDGRELIQYCSQNLMDMIFVDIDMPNMSGFDAVKKIQEHQPEITVIFVTSHKEYSYQAFEYHPYQFVDKTDLEKIDRVIDNLTKKIIRRTETDNITHLYIENKIIDIDVKEIMYIKSKRNYVTAYTVSGEELLMRIGLKAVYEQLSKVGFVYVHRSYIVNCRFIFDFGSKTILLRNNDEIPVTRDKDIRKQAQKQYSEFKRGLRW